MTVQGLIGQAVVLVGFIVGTAVAIPLGFVDFSQIGTVT
jgi:xanthine/uracil permease